MQKICSACGATNSQTTKECVACHTPLTIRFDTKFVVGKEQMTFEGLFEEVHALKNRISLIEMRHGNLEESFKARFPEMVKEELKKQPKKQQEALAIKKIVAQKQVTDLPSTIQELETVLGEIQEKYAQAQQVKNHELMADLAYEKKKIQRKIAKLEQTETRKEEPKTEQVITEKVKDLLEKDAKEEQKEELKELEKKPKKEENSKKVKHDENWATIAQLEQELARIWHARRRALQKGLLEKSAKLFEQEQEIEERLLSLKGDKSQEDKEEQKTDNKNYDPEHYKDKEEEETRPENNLETKELQKEEKEAKEQNATLENKIEEAKKTYREKVAKKQKTKQPKPKKVKPQRTGPSALEQFFAPVVSGYNYVVGKYQQFKKENKLPLFFLTLAGIAALLFGFGFLVQYSAVTYFGTFSTQVKVGFGFLCSFATMGIGVYLFGKNKKFREFGSALIGLGLALNYLFVYFLAPVMSSTMGFVLILINTAAAVVLALKYEAKIIAVLSLVGGALSPLYLQSSGENTIIYFAYLWILSASSIFIAKKIKWEALSMIAFILAGAITFLSVYMDVRSLPNITYLVLFHGFAYLFTYASLFDGKKIRKEQSTVSVIMLVGAQAVMMSSLYYVFGVLQAQYTMLGMAYIVNTLPFIAIFASSYKTLNNQQKSLLLIIASAFLFASVPALLGIGHRGPLWALEAVVLLASGFIFKLPNARRVGYLVLLGAFANVAYTMLEIPANWHIKLFTKGYFNLIVLGGVFAILYFVFDRYRDLCEKYEKPLGHIFNEALSVWFAVLIIVTGAYYTMDWLAYVAIVPAFALIFRGYYSNLKFSKYLGYTMYGTVLIYAAVHAINELQMYWGQSLYHSGYFNLLLIGAMFLALKMTLKNWLDNDKLVKPIIYGLDEALSAWMATVVIVTGAYYSLDWLAFIMIIPALALIYRGIQAKLEVTKYLGYMLYGATLIYAGIYASDTLAMNWNSHLFHSGYFNLLLIGAALVALPLLLKQTIVADDKLTQATVLALHESLSVWGTALFMVTTFFYFDEFALNLAIIPMFGLIYLGYQRKLPFTESLGLLQSLAFAAAVLFSIIESGSVHFSAQVLYGQIGGIEIMFCLWFMKFFYEKLLPDSPKIPIMDKARELFYLLLPLAVIEMVNSNFSNWLVFGLWGAAALSFVLAELTKRKTLEVEVHGLIALAAALTLFDINYIAMLVGTAILVGILVYKKGYQKEVFQSSPYKGLFTGLFFYIGACIAFSYWKLSGSDNVGTIILAGTYLIALVNLDRQLLPIQAITPTIYRLGTGLFAAGLGFVLLEAQTTTGGTMTTNFGTIVITLLGLAGLNKLVYKADIIYQGNKKTNQWQSELVALHLINMLAYTTILFILTNDLSSMLLTIILVAHGILMMFNSLNPTYRILTKLYIGVFVVAMVKLFVVDLREAEMIAKILVFIGVGVLCLVAAYFFVKYTRNDEDELIGGVDTENAIDDDTLEEE